VQSYLRIWRWANVVTEDLGPGVAKLGPPKGPLSIVAPLLLAALLVTLLFVQHGRRHWPAAMARLAWYGVLTVVMLATLLVAYHGSYDAQVVVLLLPLLLYAIAEPRPWRLGPWHRRVLGGVLALTILVLCLPGEVAGLLLGPAALRMWLSAESQLLNLTVLLVLGVALWLLLRLRPAAEGENIGG